MKKCLRWRSVKSLVGLVLLFIIGVVYCLQCSGCRRQDRLYKKICDQNIKADNIDECRISFMVNDHGPFSEVCIKESSQIENLILQPLRSSVRDPEPAKYKIIGTLTIIAKDGSRDGILLFYPWGFYEYDGEYFIANFAKLQSTCQKTLRQGVRVQEYLEGKSTIFRAKNYAGEK